MPSKKFVCITSMNQAYYEKCGRACIESYGLNWPQNIPLYVYNEDMVDPPKNKWTRYVPWSDLPVDYTNFMECQTGSRTRQFAKKAFSVIHAMQNIACDRLIWLDADVVTTMAVNPQLLDMITPDHVLSTHYGVWHDWPSEDDPDRMSFSCETGFFVVNKCHEMFGTFAQRYLDYYRNDLGYKLRRFYDGEVYGAVVAEMSAAGADMMELNPGQRHKTPIPRSVMAPYIKHYKAGAKDPFDSASLLQHANSSNLS
jgi:hypothetical protein